MGKPCGIRPFTPDDIAKVADLYHRVFMKSSSPAPVALQQRFRRFYFENPWVDPELPSLVHADADGISAFLGVLPRPFERAGRRIRVVVSSNFMVDPARRGGLAAIQLLKAFFDGPQDLAMAEGGDPSLKLWEAVGGKRIHVRSLSWVRLLRPAAYGLDTSTTTAWRPLGALLRPVAWLGDALVGALPFSPLRLGRSRTTCVEIGVDELLSLYQQDRTSVVKPVYDRASLQWLIERLAGKTSFGTLKSLAVRDDQGQALGWFVVYLNRRGASEVLQLGARAEHLPTVIQGMLSHAGQSGVHALAGQCSPTVMGPLSRQGAFFRNTGAWFLAHARDPDLTRMLEHDQLSFSRLEGEWMFFRFAEGVEKD